MLFLKRKIIYLTLSILSFLTITFLIINLFGMMSSPFDDDMNLMSFLSSLQYAYSIPILLAWQGTSLIISFIVLLFSIFFIALIVVKTNSIYYGISIFYLLILSFILFRVNKNRKDRKVLLNLESEKIIEITNLYEKELEKKTAALETLLATCAEYSSLRDLIERFASTLDMNVLNKIIVDSTFKVISKSDLVLLYILNKKGNLVLVSSKSAPGLNWKKSLKTGDIFDNWVLKNRQPLIIKNLDNDVRFDLELSILGNTFKSIMAAPIVCGSKVIGSIRVNAMNENAFNLMDCRIFNIIADVASAALNNAVLFKQTEELAITDSLTGLYVYRYFRERLKEEHRRFLLSSYPLSFIMGDLDNFKSLNDKYGHTAGDLVLKKVSAVIKSIVAEDGFVSRYGGEEIAVILPQTDKSKANIIARAIRKKIAEEKFDIRGEDVGITISLGVSSLPEDGLDIDDLIKIADDRMYIAKKSGKNKVI